jgi:hypothetical protein
MGVGIHELDRVPILRALCPVEQASRLMEGITTASLLSTLALPFEARLPTSAGHGGTPSTRGSDPASRDAGELPRTQLDAERPSSRRRTGNSERCTDLGEGESIFLS